MQLPPSSFKSSFLTVLPPAKYDLGDWGEWRECSGPAIAIKPQVHLLHLQENGTDVAEIYGIINDTFGFDFLGINNQISGRIWFPLSYYRSKIKEQTGLTDLVLVCEDKEELRSTPDERVGHVYQSNDADCSFKAKNYIKGVRMQYDKTKYPEYEPTMVANFAIACTKDYDQSILQKSVLSLFPEVPEGKSLPELGGESILLIVNIVIKIIDPPPQLIGLALPSQVSNEEPGPVLRQTTIYSKTCERSHQYCNLSVGKCFSKFDQLTPLVMHVTWIKSWQGRLTLILALLHTWFLLYQQHKTTFYIL